MSLFPTDARRPKYRLRAAIALGALVLGAFVVTPGATAATAGVPAGTTLSASGSITVTRAGAVIDRKHVKGAINVKADNVTIKNTKVTYGGYHSIRIYDGAVGTTILDSTVECTSSKTNGIVFGGYRAERVAMTGCRNDFMASAASPATVVSSSVDGLAFSTVLAPAPTPTPAPTPPPPAPAPTTPAPAPSVDSEFPTLETTGARVSYSSMTKSGGITTSYDGQVIERKDVTGNIRIKHDNVVVRDSRVSFTSTYGLYVAKKADGSCPVGAVFEYVEVDGRLAAENDIPVYSPGCGWTLDHAYVHNMGRAIKVTNNNTVSNSYVISSRTGDSGAHRGAVGNNGGRNNKVINNVLFCQGTGCSAAIPMYGDFAPVDGMLVQHNLIATTGSYCSYGGSLSGKKYPDGSNIKFIDNHFSTKYFSTCGRYGYLSGFENKVRGNEFRGNVWHETGKPIG